MATILEGQLQSIGSRQTVLEHFCYHKRTTPHRINGAKMLPQKYCVAEVCGGDKAAHRGIVRGGGTPLASSEPLSIAIHDFHLTCMLGVCW